MIATLLNGVTTSGAGDSVKLPQMLGARSGLKYPIIISGISGDTVDIEASFDDVTFEKIENGTFASDIATSLSCHFPYVRANVTSYSAGTITVKIGW